MTVISIEGASAAGKTTVCLALEAEHGFIRIPEVNELFSRAPDEAPRWYLERQIDRWKMACHVSSSGGSAVLDGDPFQPMWYNWIFPDLGFQPVAEVVRFYHDKVSAGIIHFPDKYYVLTASESELRQRKETDKSRSRRNFEKHLRLIEPQLAYFTTMNEGGAGMASILESLNARDVAKLIASDSYDLQSEGQGLALFERMCRLVREEQNNTRDSDR